MMHEIIAADRVTSSPDMDCDTGPVYSNFELSVISAFYIVCGFGLGMVVMAIVT